MSSLCVSIAAHINPQQLSRQAAFERRFRRGSLYPAPSEVLCTTDAPLLKSNQNKARAPFLSMSCVFHTL